MEKSNPTSKTTPQYKKVALLLIALLVLILIGSLVWILPTNSLFGKSSDDMIADIYQDGNLIQTIDLNQVNESYTFIITNENGSQNEIEVRPGSIGILSANCPDKLCVHQGFISTSKLPITCLPNRLVIQIRKSINNQDASATGNEPDAVTY